MKIAYIHARTLPSTEANGVHVMSMCEALTANGHSVELLVPGRASEVNLYAWYGVAATFPVRFPWPQRSSKRPTVFSAAALVSAMLRRADLIYTRDPVTAALATTFRLPTIFEAHNPLRPADCRRIERVARSPHLRRVVVISDALKGLIGEQIPALRSKLFVAHDAARLSSPPTVTKQNERFTAVYAGSFYQGRGVELILDLGSQTPDVRYLLVGGDAAAVYELTGAAVPANVELLGHRPPAEIAPILASADVLLAPYQRKTMQKTGKVDQAGYMSPLKIFEYMAAGKPIICSALPVLQEVLTDGRTALMPEPDDLSSWIAAVEALRADPQLSATLGLNAREEAIDRYSWKARAKAVLMGADDDGKRQQSSVS